MKIDFKLTRESAVLNIILASLILLGTIILFIMPAELGVDFETAKALYFVVLGGTSAFALAIIVVSALILQKTKSPDSPYPFALAVTLLVVDIVLAVLYGVDANWLYLVSCVCLATMLAMDIATFRKLKHIAQNQEMNFETDLQEQSEIPQNITEKTIDEIEKLNKLKKM